MSKEKYKRDYLPDLRKLTKELEDVIIERNDEEMEKSILRLEVVLSKIKKANYINK